eukprot:7390229-Prymnesium_polylepis.1
MVGHRHACCGWIGAWWGTGVLYRHPTRCSTRRFGCDWARGRGRRERRCTRRSMIGDFRARDTAIMSYGGDIDFFNVWKVQGLGPLDLRISKND